MAISTLATIRQTQAMLEQKRLSLKHGLPQFISFADSNKVASAPSSGASTLAPKLTQVETAAEKDWAIVAVDSKVTESNTSWWRYAWKLTLRNSGGAPHAFRATIEFQDKDGFIIDSDNKDTIQFSRMPRILQQGTC